MPPRTVDPDADPGAPLSRRDFVHRGARLAALAAAGVPLAGAPVACNLGPSAPSGPGDAHLSASPPATPPATPLAPGTYRFEGVPGREALLHVPASLATGSLAPLAVSFHGAGGRAADWLATLAPLADAAGLMLLVPQSQQPTWDLIYGPFGADAAFVDAALAWAFQRCAVDPARIAALGFSDGATCALGLGLTNGDLFSHVVAFSPGSLKTGPRRGRPRVFVSHGTEDRILPITTTSRLIVPRLGAEGYDVTYREFAGGHVILASIATEAAGWLKG